MKKVKVCTKCNQERCVTKFKPNTNKICIRCVRDLQKRICIKCGKEKRFIYFENKSEVCTTCEVQLGKTPKRSRTRKVTNRKYDSPEQRKYIAYRDNAVDKRKLLFELTQDEYYAIRNNDCTYCGESGGSIDRVDSTKGYILSNCVPCCYRCNMMKQALTVEDFISHVKKIAAFNS